MNPPHPLKLKHYIVRFWCLVSILLLIFVVQVRPGEGKSQEIIKVGLYENMPKIYQDANKKAAGFWPDLLAYIAEKENWEVQYVPGTWNQGLERLDNGDIDIMPDVAFTENRAKKFKFNDTPVVVSWSRVYTNHDNTEIKSVTDLKNKKIGVLESSVNFEGPGGLKQILHNFNLPCTFVVFDSYDMVFEALSGRMVDAGVCNRNFGNKNQKKYNLKKTPVVFQPITVKFALGMKSPGTPEYIQKIDFHMENLTRVDTSIYYQLLEKYFESEIAEKTVEIFPELIKNLFKCLVIVLFFFIITILVSRRQVKRKTFEIAEKNQALKNRETQLRTLIETIPDLIWLKDTQGKYLTCNLKFERFFGAREEEIIGKTDYDFVDRELADFFRSQDNAAIAANGPVINEEEVTYKDDGHKELLETLKTPMFDEQGQIVGVLGIARDITQRKQFQKNQKRLEEKLRQSQKMEAIGQLAGGIAHDFNNILSVIQGYAELVKSAPDKPERVKKHIGTAIKAVKQAADLVQQILIFSRKSVHKKQPLALDLLIKDAVKFVRALIPTTIEIKVHMDSQETIMADPGKIRQVIMNLATNAYHAMLETGGVLSIGLKEVNFCSQAPPTGLDLPLGRYLRLEMSDTGHGMDGATKEKIFEPYFSTKEPGKGTGLGLSVVFGIVKEHNGAIWVYSEPGQGATFHLYFPVIEEKPALLASEETEKIFPGTETILMVDDESLILEANQELLQALGYKVVTASNPKDALGIFRRNPDQYDLVITDMTMPGMNGLALSAKILATTPGQPIMLCTGHNELVNREKAKAAGIRKYIEKPVIIKDLSRAIRQILDGQS